MAFHARAGQNPGRPPRHRRAGGPSPARHVAGPVGTTMSHGPRVGPGFGERVAGWRRALGVAASGLLLAALAGCGGDGGEASSGPSLEPMYPVSEETISHGTTQQISVFSPEGDGSWPVVHLFTGSGWQAIAVAELARALAAQGVVVFAPDYRATVWGGPGRDAESDLVCSWRYGNSVAAEYGGDVDRPVTLVGVERGADQALELGLRGDANSEQSCFAAAPDPGAVVAIGPCMNRRTGFDTSGWSNRGAHVVLIAGSRIRECPKAGVEYGADQLKSGGFDTTLTTVDGDIQSMVLHQSPAVNLGAAPADADFVTAYDPDNPVGMRVAQMVLDAIDVGSL